MVSRRQVLIQLNLGNLFHPAALYSCNLLSLEKKQFHDAPQTLLPPSPWDQTKDSKLGQQFNTSIISIRDMTLPGQSLQNQYNQLFWKDFQLWMRCASSSQVPLQTNETAGMFTG